MGGAFFGMDSIRFERVSKSYPNTPNPAVHAVTLDVPAGELLVLLGGSGSGKTTLLKMVNRLIEPTSGEIWLDDQPLTQLNLIDVRRQMGYVIQQVGLLPHLTVAQNVAVVPELLRWPRPKIAARVAELLNLVGLPPAEFAHRYPAQLSGGQQQRVGLARALAAYPRVLLMDEPFGALDALTRASLQTELARLHAHLGTTTLFVTHDAEEAFRLADRIAILREGQLEQVDTPLNLLRRPANAFVHQLLGASDLTRQLSLLPARQLMLPLPAALPSAPRLPDAADGRAALSLLLQTPGACVVVTQADQPVGYITWEALRAALRQP